MYYLRKNYPCFTFVVRNFCMSQQSYSPFSKQMFVVWLVRAGLASGFTAIQGKWFQTWPRATGQWVLQQSVSEGENNPNIWIKLLSSILNSKSRNEVSQKQLSLRNSELLVSTF